MKDKIYLEWYRNIKYSIEKWIFNDNIYKGKIKIADLDYIQYDSKKWTTPAKYTNRKPCDCYTEWML